MVTFQAVTSHISAVVNSTLMITHILAAGLVKKDGGGWMMMYVSLMMMYVSLMMMSVSLIMMRVSLMMMCVSLMMMYVSLMMMHVSTMMMSVSLMVMPHCLCRSCGET